MTPRKESEAVPEEFARLEGHAKIGEVWIGKQFVFAADILHARAMVQFINFNVEARIKAEREECHKKFEDAQGAEQRGAVKALEMAADVAATWGLCEAAFAHKTDCGTGIDIAANLRALADRVRRGEGKI